MKKKVLLSYYRLSCIETTSRQKKKIQEFESVPGGWGDFEISVSKLQQNNTSEREGIEREREKRREIFSTIYTVLIHIDSYFKSSSFVL